MKTNWLRVKQDNKLKLNLSRSTKQWLLLPQNLELQERYEWVGPISNQAVKL